MIGIKGIKEIGMEEDEEIGMEDEKEMERFFLCHKVLVGVEG